MSEERLLKGRLAVIDRGMLEQEDGVYYLPVVVVYVDRTKGAALVNLPIEADSGAHRLWVRLQDVRDLANEVPA
jgi:hypothetical protein